MKNSFCPHHLPGPRFFALALSGLIIAAAAFAVERSGWDTYSDTWVATDGLGRRVADHAAVGDPRPDRWVGLFYFLWLGQHGTSGPHDITRILEQDPEAMEKPDSPLWGPPMDYHHWGEPLFGYYLSDDAWVLRRHAQMLSDAGVDVVIFDITNNFTYRENYRALLSVWDQVRADGGETPQVAFLTPFAAPAQAVEALFEDLYGPGDYEDFWFRWEGKPLIMANPAVVPERYRDFFTFRNPEPSYFVPPVEPGMWSWLQVYPQHVFYKDDPAVPEQMAVGVGQNARDGRLSAFSEKGARGRSFSHYGGHPGDMRWTNFGLNFEEQFSRVLRIDPAFIFITGWNEWVAMRMNEFNEVAEPVMFVDVFTEEYTRDIEPTRGFTADHYHYQMINAIRQYKGVRRPPLASPRKTIDLDGPFSQWDQVEPEFRDDMGDTMHRNHPGWGAAGPYRDETGRNDFVAMKVARDEEYLYFYVRTRDPITPASDLHWMWLLLNTDGDSRTGWEGYNYVVNRRSPVEGRAYLEVSAGGWDWRPRGEVDFRQEGNQMHLRISRGLLPDARPGKPLQLEFKWADNVQAPGDILDFHLSGDVAPNGRFSYRYVAD